MNRTLIKNFSAEGAITKYRIIKIGAADGGVLQGAAATDAVFGVATDVGAALGERCDVVMAGITHVEYGGNVNRGDLLVSDANGKAVAAAPAAGVNNRVIGMAMVSAVDGDIADMWLAAHQIQGA
ncbi:MAG: capsid cement protein [Magnetospiraceae bacterium]